MSFYGAADTPVLDSGFSKLEWAALFALDSGIHVTHSQDSPLVQQLLTSWWPAWLSHFDPHTCKHTNISGT